MHVNGIIPARAGFTGLAIGSNGRRGDHPRSRGVYRGSGSSFGAFRGSSPLARGLLNLCSASLCGLVDHPRSRGVYGSRCSLWFPFVGSSPLARGLPLSHPTDPYSLGIIPARAGFTSCPPRGTGSPGDHPRSRGVYWSRHWIEWPAGGSSPLARGLPSVAGRWPVDHRIIPARAGFTWPAFTHTSAREDHPRSRGVYDCRPTPYGDLSGSSPLARGLP